MVEASVLLRVGHGAVCGRRMALYQPTFRERDHAVPGHDKMVDDPHVHQAQCRLQRLCQHFIGPRRLGFPRGVVVGDGQKLSSKPRVQERSYTLVAK